MSSDCSASSARRARRAVSHVADEYVAGDEMAKAGGAGAQAEVDLDAVVAAQRRAVEGADGGDAIAREVQARAMNGGQRMRLAGVRVREQRVQARDIAAVRQIVVRARQRIGLDAGAVGERADDTDAARVGVPREPVEPVAGDDGVRLHDNLVAAGMQRERLVERGGATARRRRVHQRDRMARGELAQVTRELGLRTRVADDDHVKRRLLPAGEDGFETAPRGTGACIARNGDDDVDGRLAAVLGREALAGGRERGGGGGRGNQGTRDGAPRSSARRGVNALL